MPKIVPSHEDHRAVLVALADGAVIGIRRIIARDRRRRSVAMPLDHDARVVAALRLQVQSGRVAARPVGESVQFTLTRDGKKALRGESRRRSRPMLGSLACAASAAALLAGCATPNPAPQARVPLMGYPTPVGMQQVRDQLGRPVYEPCNPCATPSPKTPVFDGKAWNETASTVPVPASASASAANRVELGRGAMSPPSLDVAAVVPPRPAVAPPRPTTQAEEASKTAVLFGFASSKLNAKGRRAIAEFVKAASQGSNFYVRGVADSTGDTVVNEILARNRAAVVRAELISHGVPRSKVKVSACPSCYTQDNGTKDGRKANRRVDLSLAPMTF